MRRISDFHVRVLLDDVAQLRSVPHQYGRRLRVVCGHVRFLVVAMDVEETAIAVFEEMDLCVDNRATSLLVIGFVATSNDERSGYVDLPDVFELVTLVCQGLDGRRRTLCLVIFWLGVERPLDLFVLFEVGLLQFWVLLALFLSCHRRLSLSSASRLPQMHSLFGRRRDPSLHSLRRGTERLKVASSFELVLVSQMEQRCHWQVRELQARFSFVSH